MEISKELLDMGLTEELLLFFHNRTANSKYTIKSAYKSRYEPYSHDGVKVVLVTDGGVLQYIVNIAKIRQKRLNIILNVK
jgi:nucleosome binding factor SPN SPT16 subunit